MGNRLISLIVAVVVAFAYLPIGAQTAQQAGGTKLRATKSAPDISGVWLRHEEPDRVYEYTKEPLPMQPWAEEKYKYNLNPLHADGRARNEVDPTYLCMPPGWLQIVLRRWPFEIIQIPNRVLIHYEMGNVIRQIWMDGRKHPEVPEPSWWGHSIGRWDGDTLLVDTVGLREETWLDNAGHVHSDALHVVERYRRVSQDTLEIEYTFDDPKAYTKPFTGKKVFKLEPDWEIGEGAYCEDRWLKGTP